MPRLTITRFASTMLNGLELFVTQQNKLLCVLETFLSTVEKRKEFDIEMSAVAPHRSDVRPPMVG